MLLENILLGYVVRTISTWSGPGHEPYPKQTNKKNVQDKVIVCLFVSVSVCTQQFRASPRTALLQQPIALEWGSPIQLLTGPNVAWLQWSKGNWYLNMAKAVGAWRAQLDDKWKLRVKTNSKPCSTEKADRKKNVFGGHSSDYYASGIGFVPTP